MPHTIRSIAVYCGSNTGFGEAYVAAARALGAEIGRRGLTLIYGGTIKGLMGVVADATLAAGGPVHGVITRRLVDKEHLHPHLTRHEIVTTMRERKARMESLADAAIALPGGVGTLEEFAELWTLNQLGEVEKPAGLLNVNGFYDPFLVFLDRMVSEGFLPAAHRQAVIVGEQPASVLDALFAARPVSVPKWL